MFENHDFPYFFKIVLAPYVGWGWRAFSTPLMDKAHW